MRQENNMAEKDTEQNNSALFRKKVREYNKETGFNFTLPKDTDYTSRYAHPIHEEGMIKVTGQIDTDDDDNKIYGLQVNVEGVGGVYLNTLKGDEMTPELLKKALAYDSFKDRCEHIKQMKALREELQEKIDITMQYIFTDSIRDMEKEEKYDIVSQVARRLYKVK